MYETAIGRSTLALFKPQDCGRFGLLKCRISCVSLRDRWGISHLEGNPLQSEKAS